MHRSLHLATRNAPEPVRMTVAQTVGRRMLPARSFHIHRYAFDFTGEWKGGCIVAGYGSAAVLTDTEQLARPRVARSEEHTSELQSLMRISYAVFCLKQKKYKNH